MPTNVQAIAGQRYLQINTRNQSQTLEKLSSGSRINRAGDDAAPGSLHGVTLGFGVTLIGEAVDYAIYLFTHMGHAEPADLHPGL